jgi:3-deoxy-manno-octulosonate cytidylyltransferase (CMP-KDO synthetase)
LPVPPVSASGTRTVIVIPARYQSSRLPGKVLSDIGGRPMIEHVYRRAVEAFGGRVLMTSERHPTGTDRLAEAIRYLDASIVINVQGDEPLIEPAMIDEAAAAVEANPDAAIGTLRKAIADPSDLANPNVVKIAVDLRGRALYFSRSPIPFERDPGRRQTAWRHIGVYAYRREALLALAALPPAPLEQSESLEQLRALEHGFVIQTHETGHDTIGVDTAEDLERVRRRVARTG